MHLSPVANAKLRKSIHFPSRPEEYLPGSEIKHLKNGPHIDMTPVGDNLQKKEEKLAVSEETVSRRKLDVLNFKEGDIAEKEKKEKTKKENSLHIKGEKPAVLQNY
jgi:hypothetical protein